MSELFAIRNRWLASWRLDRSRQPTVKVGRYAVTVHQWSDTSFEVVVDGRSVGPIHTSLDDAKNAVFEAMRAAIRNQRESK